MTTLRKRALAPGAMVVLSVIFAVSAATERRWGGVATWAGQATFWVLFLWFSWKRWKQES